MLHSVRDVVVLPATRPLFGVVAVLGSILAFVLLLGAGRIHPIVIYLLELFLAT